jgi:uncharacterized protein (TIGR02391 family)
MDTEKLRKIYGRLVGLRNSLPPSPTNFRKEIGEDFDRIVDEISKLVNEDLGNHKIPSSAYWGREYCDGGIGRSKVEQFVSYLEFGYNLSDKVLEIGSLVNTIKDQELKDRCLDLLSAHGKFDRVINQATLILEDKIRKKSGITERLEGVKLINKVLNSDLSKTILKASNEPDEHNGICDTCRGLMLAFRNPTHHHLSDKFTREEALKFCGFIDTLLGIIDSSEKIR